MIAVGCDVGSLFIKVAVLDDDRLLGSRMARATGNAEAEVKGLIREALAQAGVKEDRVELLAATGNGARLTPGADFTEDVITCVGAAVGYFAPEARVAIDMGGQSITSLLLSEEGEVMNFMRNDKCASGSGRFLEVIAAKLGVEVDAIDRSASSAGKTVEISNQCGVFAESEVISHVNNGETVPDVMAGACAAVARMVAAQGRKFGAGQPFTLTGGVARIGAVNRVVGEKLGGTRVPFPFDPQLAAAVGAALLSDTQ
jgi:predicted CoA-substrate-specific enzyme activase